MKLVKVNLRYMAHALLLILSMTVGYTAFGQIASDIPVGAEAKVADGTSMIQVTVGGKLALCSHSEKGSIELDVAGGRAPYTFKWNTNQTTQNRYNLNAGTYTVVITDSQGTQQTMSIIVQPPFPLLLNPVEKTDATCGSATNGSAKISVKLGRNEYEADRPDYEVTWSNGLKNVWEANNLAPGTYTVIVADKYHCDTSISFDIKAAAEGIQVGETIMQPTCASPESGSITLNPSGGSAPYTYEWSNGTTAKNLTNVGPGSYQVLVTDSKGCSIEESYLLTAPSSLSLQSSVKEISCQSEGSLAVKAVGGTAPYTYKWSSGQTDSAISGIVPGSYSVWVTDATGCSAEKHLVLADHASLRLEVIDTRSASCSGANGGISLKVSGSSGSYSLTWSDGVKDLLQRRDLPAGEYTITAIDQAGCAATVSTVVGESSSIQAKIETALDMDCTSGKATGIAWVSIQGGTAPYDIRWDDNNSTSREIQFSAAGILKVTVTDAKGCISSAQAKVDFPNQNKENSRLDFNYRKLKITSEAEVMIQDEVLFESEIAPEIIAWEWDFGDGGKSTEKDPIHLFAEAGEFEVKLTGYDLFGCATVESNRISVNAPEEMIVIPNAFTPNGDGLNDTFKPKLRGVSSFHMEIFNTWGEKIYATSSLEDKGWDGSYKGPLAPAGNYLYQINYTSLDGQSYQRTGGITLIR